MVSLLQALIDVCLDSFTQGAHPAWMQPDSSSVAMKDVPPVR